MEPWMEILKSYGLPTVGCIAAGAFFWRLGNRAMDKGEWLIALIGSHIENTTKEIREINPKLDKIAAKQEEIHEHLKLGVCNAPEPGRKSVTRHA